MTLAERRVLDARLDWKGSWHGAATDPRMLSSYQGCSALATLEAEKHRPDAAEGMYVGPESPSTGQKWKRRTVVTSAPGIHRADRKTARLSPTRAAYLTKRQAEYAAQWDANGPHICQCGCGMAMKAGNFSRPPKRFERGHNANAQGWGAYQRRKKQQSAA